MSKWLPIMALVGALAVWTAGCSNDAADDGSDSKQAQPAQDGSQSKPQQEPGSGTY